MGTSKLNPVIVKTWPKFVRARDSYVCYRNPACPQHGENARLRGAIEPCTCIPQDHVMFYAENAAKITASKADIKPDIGALVDNNPKTRVGALKAPLHLVPPSAEFHLAEALADGAAKYGAYNWREEPISVSTYIGAIKRHLGAFWDGEDLATDSGVHHLAHVMACCALLLDSNALGILQDDRPAAGAISKLLKEYHDAKV